MNRLFKAGYKKEVKIPKYSPLSFGQTCVYRTVLRTNESTNEYPRKCGNIDLTLLYNISVPWQYFEINPYI